MAVYRLRVDSPNFSWRSVDGFISVDERVLWKVKLNRSFDICEFEAIEGPEIVLERKTKGFRFLTIMHVNGHALCVFDGSRETRFEDRKLWRDGRNRIFLEHEQICWIDYPYRLGDDELVRLRWEHDRPELAVLIAYYACCAYVDRDRLSAPGRVGSADVRRVWIGRAFFILPGSSSAPSRSSGMVERGASVD